MVSFTRTKKQAGKKGSTAAAAVQDAAGSTWEKVTPAAESAWARVAPVAEDAYGKVSEAVVPAVQDARAKVAPLAGQALRESRRHGRKAAVKLGVVEEPKKRHRLRKFLALVGLAGLGAYVYKKFADDSGAGGGAYSPTRNETAPTAPFPSKETVESTTPTTPDNPVQQTDVG